MKIALYPGTFDPITYGHIDVIKKLVENLAAEGIKGEIAAVQGLDISGQELNLQEGLKVRKHTSF